MKTNSNPIETVLGHGSAGWYVEWFQEDHSTPMGFRAARWYGSREQCDERKNGPVPALCPAREHDEHFYPRAE
jgi:hypothetical protein